MIYCAHMQHVMVQKHHSMLEICRNYGKLFSRACERMNRNGRAIFFN